MTLKTRMPPLSIIVAVDSNGGFGKDGKIPWSISEDMKHFKEVTTGGICIMGRRTYEDMYGMVQERKKAAEETQSTVDTKKTLVAALLKDRKSFVITSDTDYKPYGAQAVPTIRAAIETLDELDKREIFIIGGYRMFIEAMPYTQTVYLTIIKDKDYQCDRHFPIQLLNRQYKIVEGKETDELYFLTYKRG